MSTCYNCFREYRTAGKCPHCGYDASADAGKNHNALRPGSILGGRYIVGRVLGQGGFGITYVAQEYNTKRIVAIKEYMPSMMAGRSGGSSQVNVYSAQFEEEYNTHRKNFLIEAKTLSQFNGTDGVCDIYNYFEENGTAYFAMEYVDGLSLGKYMEKNGRLTVEQAMSLMLPVMRVLDHIHSKGLIHRDIAPDNIMIGNNGKVYLIDFGAARYSLGEVSRSLDIVIKHGFAPREQYARHGRQGPFTDVYAMGATFYYAITGRKPPEAMDRDEMDDLALPSTLGVRASSGVEDVLLKALAPRAADRYQRMAEFAMALTQAVYSNVGVGGSSSANGQWGGKDNQKTEKLIYDSKCPHCGKKISFGQSTLNAGRCACPACGKWIKFNVNKAENSEQNKNKLNSYDHADAVNHMISELSGLDGIRSSQIPGSISGGETVSELIAKADKAYNSNDYAAVIKYMQKALALDKQNIDVYNKLGRAYRCQGLYEDARKCYEQALKMSPGDIVTIGNLGTLELFQANFDRAYSNIKYAYDNLPSKAGQRGWDERATITANFALVTAKTGNKAEGLRLLEEARRKGYGNYAELKKQIDAVPGQGGTGGKKPAKKKNWAIGAVAALVLYVIGSAAGRAVVLENEPSYDSKPKTKVVATVAPSATPKPTPKPTPTPKPDTIDFLYGEWYSPVYVRGNGESSAAFNLDEPVINSTGLTLNIAISYYTGYPFDEWYLYIHDLDGNWRPAAMFVLEDDMEIDEYYEFPLSFEKPESFDALSICHVYDGYVFSLSYDLYFTDVKLK